MPKDPNPSPSPSPEGAQPPSEAASSPASARASASEAASFIGDPGPAFDAEAAAAEPPPEPVPPAGPSAEPDVQWEETVVRSILGIQGRFLHAGIGVSEQDWLHTDLDLAAIAPPLTRIFNRYEPIRRYAAHADPITVAVGVSGYATRSLLERRRELADQEEHEGGEVEVEPLAPMTAPAPAPRAAGQFPTAPAGAPPPPPPAAPRAPAPPPRPAEAPVDPAALDWRVGE